MRISHALDAVLLGCTVLVVSESRPRDLVAVFESRGASVHPVVVSAPERPQDQGVLARSAERAAGGEADTVVFTSVSAAASWAAVAERSEVLGPLRRRAQSGRLLLATGQDLFAAPLRAVGLRTMIAVHDHPGALEQMIVEHFADERSRSLPTESGRIEVRSGGVVVGGEYIALSRSAVSLIDALASAGGRVISRAELGGVLPGGERTAHAVEVAVARLRESLGDKALVHTVVKRGYRLAVIEE